MAVSIYFDQASITGAAVAEESSNYKTAGVIIASLVISVNMTIGPALTKVAVVSSP